METTILALASLLLAGVLAISGLAGLAARTGRTPQHRRRRAGWRAAGATLIGAAGPPLLLGVVLLVRPPEQLADWFLIYALAGVATGGLIALARRRADLAAAGPADTLPAHEEEHR
jgi:MFS family permease